MISPALASGNTLHVLQLALQAELSTWSQWHATGGRAGEEPPEELKAQLDRWNTLITTTDEQLAIQMGKEILRSQAENLWTIGTVGMLPRPIVMNPTLRNVPEESIFGWDTFWTGPAFPEQFFFDR